MPRFSFERSLQGKLPLLLLTVAWLTAACGGKGLGAGGSHDASAGNNDTHAAAVGVGGAIQTGGAIGSGGNGGLGGIAAAGGRPGTGGIVSFGGSISTDGAGSGGVTGTFSGANVVAVVVDQGAQNVGYTNGLFAAVTVCVPDTSSCQTIDHLLVDTGSVGLRILESELTLDLPAAKNASGSALAECSPFIDGTAWGGADSRT